MDSVVLIVADGAVINGYIITGLDVQLLAVLDSAVVQLAAAAALVVEIVIAGIMRDVRTICHVHGCTAFNPDVLSISHPNRCVAQVQRAAVHINVVGHGAVVIAE